MATLPISIQMGSLPGAVRWSPQQLADAMVARMSLQTAATFALFVTGSTAPSSNVGPWLRNDNTWYVWDNGTGTYVPQTLAQESLGYFIGSAAPDENVYQFWIETTAGGSPLAVKIYFGGAWVDVYAATLASYQTIAAYNASIANYSTTAQMTAAIAAAVASVTFASYPAQAELTAGPQGITLGAAAVKCTLNLAPINPAPVPFSTVNSRYVAPVDGIYSAGVTAVFGNNTGTPAGMAITLRLYVNGADTGVFVFNGTPSPNSSQWTVAIPPILVDLNATDYIEFFVEATDGVDTGIVNITNIDASFHRVSA